MDGWDFPSVDPCVPPPVHDDNDDHGCLVVMVHNHRLHSMRYEWDYKTLQEFRIPIHLDIIPYTLLLNLLVHNWKWQPRAMDSQAIDHTNHNIRDPFVLVHFVHVMTIVKHDPPPTMRTLFGDPQWLELAVLPPVDQALASCRCCYDSSRKGRMRPRNAWRMIVSSYAVTRIIVCSDNIRALSFEKVAFVSISLFFLSWEAGYSIDVVVAGMHIYSVFFCRWVSVCSWIGFGPIWLDLFSKF